MSLYADISWGRKTLLSQDELNKRAKIIADAIEALRAFVPDWEAEVEALKSIGLDRINEALMPAYQQVLEISHLGSLFSATSQSTVTIGTGAKTFVIDSAMRLNFAPAAYLMIFANDDFDLAMVGRLSSYDEETGSLTVTVESTRGTGSFSSWDISPIATTADLEALRDDVEAMAADVALKHAEVVTKHAHVSAVGDLYYGARDTAPTGAPLGAQYLDTAATPNVVKVLTEAGWNPAVTVSIGGVRSQDYGSATGVGPFTVDGGFTFGDVYINGLKLTEGVDVTTVAASGTFTLAAAKLATDEMSFRGYLANSGVDTYTKNEINAFRLNDRNEAVDEERLPSRLRSSSIPSQAVAIAGEDNEVPMTSLRTRQAIDARVPLAIGVDQSWNDVLASRVLNTAYQNTTERPIMVSITGNSANRIWVSQDGANYVSAAGGPISNNFLCGYAAIVPPGHFYKVTGTVNAWAELR